MLSCFPKYASPDPNNIIKSVIDMYEIQSQKAIREPEIPKQHSGYVYDPPVTETSKKPWFLRAKPRHSHSIRKSKQMIHKNPQIHFQQQRIQVGANKRSLLQEKANKTVSSSSGRYPIVLHGPSTSWFV